MRCLWAVPASACIAAGSTGKGIVARGALTLAGPHCACLLLVCSTVRLQPGGPGVPHCKRAAKARAKRTNSGQILLGRTSLAETGISRIGRHICSCGTPQQGLASQDRSCSTGSAVGSNSPPDALPGRDARARSTLRGRLSTLRQYSVIGNLLSPDFRGAPLRPCSCSNPLSTQCSLRCTASGDGQRLKQPASQQSNETEGWNTPHYNIWIWSARRCAALAATEGLRHRKRTVGLPAGNEASNLSRCIQK